jgi:hypothetical protein
VVEEGEYYEEVLEAVRDDWISEKIANLSIESRSVTPSGEDEDALNWAQADCSKTAYVINENIRSLISR